MILRAYTALDKLGGEIKIKKTNLCTVLFFKRQVHYSIISSDRCSTNYIMIFTRILKINVHNSSFQQTNWEEERINIWTHYGREITAFFNLIGCRVVTIITTTNYYWLSKQSAIRELAHTYTTYACGSYITCIAFSNLI